MTVRHIMGSANRKLLPETHLVLSLQLALLKRGEERSDYATPLSGLAICELYCTRRAKGMRRAHARTRAGRILHPLHPVPRRVPPVRKLRYDSGFVIIGRLDHDLR